MLWNSLPKELRAITNLNIFKAREAHVKVIWDFNNDLLKVL